MSYTAPNVYYSATLDGTYTLINGVQSVNIQRGKQRFQDPYNSAQCTIELIPDATYSLPFALGQYVDLRASNSGSSPCWFNGRIVNIERLYDIPYNSTTGYAPGDRIVLTVTGGTGGLAGSLVTPIGVDYDCMTAMQYMTGAKVWNFAPYVLTGVTYSVPPVDIINPENNQVISYLDYINTVLNTCQYSIDEADMSRTPIYEAGFPYDYYVGVYTRPNSDPTTSFTLTDNYTGAAGTYKYSGIQYIASAQSTFTQVSVRSTNYAEQTVTTGVAPYNSLIYNTYSSSTTAALSLANYVLSTNGSASLSPFMVETSTAVSDAVSSLTQLATSGMGTAVTVVFRGSTVTAVLVGLSVAFYADRMNCRFYLSPSLGTPFTLDSSAFGVLDTNRLGYP